MTARSFDTNLVMISVLQMGVYLNAVGFQVEFAVHDDIDCFQIIAQTDLSLSSIQSADSGLIYGVYFAELPSIPSSQLLTTLELSLSTVGAYL